MKNKQEPQKEKAEKIPWLVRHPRINTLLTIVFLIGLVVGAFFLIKWLLGLLGNGISSLVSWIKTTLSNTEAVIVVALITGAFSVFSVLVSSVVSKIIENKQSRRDYLNQKREEPYKQFLDMYYKLLTQNTHHNKYSEEKKIADIQEFSKGLTLWGSNRVVKLWVQFRTQASKSESAENVYLLEKLMYAMRKDMGFRRMKKGTLLKFFINDLDEHKGEKK